MLTKCFYQTFSTRPPPVPLTAPTPSTPGGVHCLAVLLMELQPGTDGPQILASDALYQLGRVEEAHRLLLALGAAGQRGPILARLALLQLNRGFMYDANQVRSTLLKHAQTHSTLSQEVSSGSWLSEATRTATGAPD